MRNGKTERFIRESVEAARRCESVRIITSKRDAMVVHAMVGEHEDGSRKGEVWHFGPGTVEVVT